MAKENVLPLEQAAKSAPAGQRTKPIFLRQLYDLLGTGKATGEAIGCSDGYISTALRDNDVALVYELAAGHVLARDHKQVNERMVLICASHETCAQIENFVKIAGGRVSGVPQPK